MWWGVIACGDTDNWISEPGYLGSNLLVYSAMVAPLTLSRNATTLMMLISVSGILSIVLHCSWGATREICMVASVKSMFLVLVGSIIFSQDSCVPPLCFWLPQFHFRLWPLIMLAMYLVLVCWLVTCGHLFWFPFLWGRQRVLWHSFHKLFYILGAFGVVVLCSPGVVLASSLI